MFMTQLFLGQRRWVDRTVPHSAGGEDAPRNNHTSGFAVGGRDRHGVRTKLATGCAHKNHARRCADKPGVAGFVSTSPGVVFVRTSSCELCPNAVPIPPANSKATSVVVARRILSSCAMRHGS